MNNTKRRLDNCKVCDKLISINANDCPHCGEPNPTAGKKGRDLKKDIKKQLIVIVILGVGGIAIYQYATTTLNNTISNLSFNKKSE